MPFNKSLKDDREYQDDLDRRNREVNFRINNPNGEPVGHFTGRCFKCGSNDLWDDNMHYGCNKCGAFLM